MVGPLRMDSCPVDSTHAVALVLTECRSGEWSCCLPQPIYTTLPGKDYFILDRSIPVAFCCNKASRQAEPHGGGSISPCRSPTIVWPLSRLQRTLRVSHYGSAATLSPLAHASRLSATTPKGLGIATWCDPHAPTRGPSALLPSGAM